MSETIFEPLVIPPVATCVAVVVRTPVTRAVVAMFTAPSMSTMSRFEVPSTSISPEMSREATVAVPVSVGAVNDLFVRVCEPVRVATVLSIAKVTALPVAELLRPVPPDTVNVSLSKSIAIVPLSVVMSKSSAVI